MFFNRPDVLERSFAEIRAARPSRLYLHQDGPRPSRPDDLANISRCREIVSCIDWECEVHKRYQESNIGCGPAQFYAERWMFSHEDAGIVLEDDVLPSASFFRYCAELLDRYRCDTRIDRICGMNNLGTWQSADSDYFYATTGSIVGWASWRRVVAAWDATYDWLDDNRSLQLAEDFACNRRAFRAAVDRAKQRRVIGQPFHETAGGFAQWLNSRLLVVPTRNMVTIIGQTSEASHGPEDIRMLPRRTRHLFDMERHELDFPLKHPRYVLRDSAYERAMTSTVLQNRLARMEGVLLTLRYGGLRALRDRVRRRLRRR